MRDCEQQIVWRGEDGDLEILTMVKLGEEDTDWSYTALPTLRTPKLEIYSIYLFVF